MDQRDGAQGKPFDSARTRGFPVRTAVTYDGSCTSQSCDWVSGSEASTATSAIGSPRSESMIHCDLRVVSEACPERT